jgi:two-component system CheB/CheR fusion protein
VADADAESALSSEKELTALFAIVRSVSGIDFTYYKHNTIRRRIARRMAVSGIQSMEEYSRRLREDRAEAKILAQEFLISVTAFFREPETYKILQNTVLPALVEHRRHDDPIRIWVPGCATGEEAYSIAIVLTEYLEREAISGVIQIFATDLSEPAIEKARSGVYLENGLTGVSEERLKRFFIKRDRSYQVIQAIRSACVFAKQDLTKDPPFSKLDLISCCNLLIYLGPLLQKKAISLFEYALKPGGFLVLGTSESIGTHATAFEIVDRKQRIFAKKKSIGHPALEFSAENAGSTVNAPENALPENGGAFKDLQKYIDRILLAEYAPAGVVVGTGLQVLQVRGDTSPYLQLPPGEPTADLTRLVKPGLLGPLKSAILKVQKEKAPVVESGIRVKSNGQLRSVVLRVSPIRRPNDREECFLILFDDTVREEMDAPAHQKRKKGHCTQATAGRRNLASGTRAGSNPGLLAVDYRITRSRH